MNKLSKMEKDMKAVVEDHGLHLSATCGKKHIKYRIENDDGESRIVVGAKTYGGGHSGGRGMLNFIALVKRTCRELS